MTLGLVGGELVGQAIFVLRDDTAYRLRYASATESRAHPLRQGQGFADHNKVSCLVSQLIMYAPRPT